MMVQILGLESYRRAALTGLVVSVGGLTESLVRHSSASVLDFVFGLEEADLAAFGADLLAILEAHPKDDRVVVPLMKTLDLLMSNGCLEPLLVDEECAVAATLLDLCKKECVKCTDVNKISAAIDVYCGVLAAEGPPKKRALSLLLLTLTHRYPRVRKLAAEKIFTGLMAVEDVVPEEHEEEVNEILESTLWDGDVKEARPRRNRICELVGVAVPKLKVKAKTAGGEAAAAAKVKDDLESYRDLVDRSGY